MTDFSKLSDQQLMELAGIRGMTVTPKSTVPPQVASQQLSGAKEMEGLLNVSAGLETILDAPKYVKNAVVSTAQGAMDLPLGAGQLASKVGGLLGATDAEKQYSNFMSEREASHQEMRGTNAGPDIARITGSAVTALPFGGPAAATLPGRMAQGAKIGGALAATSPVDPSNEGPLGTGYWGNKALQLAVGTVAGGLAPPIVEGLVKASGATINTLSNIGRGLYNRVSGQTNPQTIESTLRLEVERGGVDWTRLPEAVRSSLVADVQNALRGGGSIDANAARRTADFASLNMSPLAGQVSRNPSQFAQEQNLARTQVGAPIADRLGQQNTQLIEGVSGLRPPNTGPDAYAAGQQVISGLRAKDAPVKAGVSEAYTQARNLAGVEANVPIQPVAQRLGQIVEDFGDDKIPSAVMKRLNEFGVNGGTQTRVFNIREAEKLKTLISNNIDNPQTPQGTALQRLRQSVDDAVNSLAEGGAGSEAATAFQRARGLASRRFGAIDRTPALENALKPDGTIAPEKFVEKFAIRGEVQDVANLMRQLPVESRDQVRAGVLDWIRAQSVNGADDAAKFSQAGFNKALRSIGDRKLDLIFAGDRQTLETLRTIGRVSGYVQSPPVASGVNYSGSGTAVLDFLDRATRLPVIGPLMGKPSDMVRATQVARAINGGPPVIPPQQLISNDLLNRIGAPAGLLAAPLAAGAAR